MIARKWLVVVVAAWAAAAGAAAPKLPVLSLAYDATVGAAETDDEALEETAHRHQVSLRAREEWSRQVVSTLAAELVRRIALTGSTPSSTAIAVSPGLRWTVVEGVKLDLGLGARRSLYDAPYASGESRDLTRLQGEATFALTLVKGLSVSPRVGASFELYDDPVRSRQTMKAALGVDARLGGWSLGADYRGSLRSPLGSLSLVERRLDHAFGVDLSWDPNKTGGARGAAREDE